tara:strand:+ start:752 stop:901 length:150 start_codon:yes stop_codon:yes gene_type:complete
MQEVKIINLKGFFMSNFWHDLLFPIYFFVVFIAAHIALYIMIFKGDKSK